MARKKLRKKSSLGSTKKAPPNATNNSKRGSIHSILTNKQARCSAVNAIDSTTHLEASLTQEDPHGGWEEMEKFLMAAEAVSAEMDPDLTASAIIQETCKLIDAERATLFFVDAEAHELILVRAKGAQNITVPIGTGIAGKVAESGEPINIPDAYDDPRFSPAYDKKTGFRTRAILCIPVKEATGDIVAVLQCINKANGGYFSDKDQFVTERFAQHIGVTLQNSRLFENERQAKHKIAALLDIVEMIHNPQTTENSLIFALSNKAHELVNGDRCTLYLLDQGREQLVVQQGDIDFRFPMSKGIAGYVASTGKTLLIDDAYEDARFSNAMDKQSGYRTKAMLCVAILGKRVQGHKNVVGVLQIINKVDDGEVFTKADVDLITTLLNIAGPLLEKGKLMENLSKAPVAAEADVATKLPRKKSNYKPTLGYINSSVVEEEEEDDW